MSAATDELGAPPNAQKSINRMGDAFRSKMKEAIPENTKKLPTAIAPAAPPKPKEQPAPSPAPATKPSEKPAEKPEPVPVPAPIPEPAKPVVTPQPAAEASKIPKTHKDWADLNSVKEKAIQERDAIKAERDTLKAELETHKKGSAEYERIKAEHETVKQQLQEKDKALAERDDVLSKVFVEHDPQFQKHFNNRLASAKADAQEIVGKDLAAKLDAVLSMSPSDHRKELIEALGAELTPFQQSQLATAYQQVRLIERERQAELDKAGENKKIILAERERKEKEQTAQIEQNRRSMIESVDQKIEPELIGLDAASASSLKSQLHKIVTGDASRDEFLNMLTNAARGHKYESEIKERDETIAKLNAQVEELTRGVAPLNGTGGGERIHRTPTADPVEMGRGLGDKFRTALNKRP